jgi:polysaccharide export outer membrane protein
MVLTKRTTSFVIGLVLTLPAIAGAQSSPATPTADSAATQNQDTPPAGDRYVIGPQDNLSINVVDEPDLSGKYRIDTDGTLTFPYVGRVRVAGLTLEDLQSHLTALLKAGYIKNPQVRIEVDQYKSRNVFVIGEVRTPGKVTMTGATMTLLEALALAGSPTLNASNEVIVVHPSKRGVTAPNGTPAPDIEGERITLNRKDLELGKVGQDLVLLDGDIINVPVAQRFYISGFVRNPGYYVLDPGMTIDQAIALAGGLNDRGSDRRITVKRLVNGKLGEVSVKLEDKVQSNDTINIPARFF